jgi:hypothetical protein
MYFIAREDTCKKAMMSGPPFGPGFTEEQASQAHSMDIMASSFTAGGDDFVLFKLKNRLGEVIAEHKLRGY